MLYNYIIELTKDEVKYLNKQLIFSELDSLDPLNDFLLSRESAYIPKTDKIRKKVYEIIKEISAYNGILNYQDCIDQMKYLVDEEKICELEKTIQVDQEERNAHLLVVDEDNFKIIQKEKGELSTKDYIDMLITKEMPKWIYKDELFAAVQKICARLEAREFDCSESIRLAEKITKMWNVLADQFCCLTI